MLMFILTISCLTVSSFLWFMDLTFQVPIRYSFMWHWILLLSLDTSTTEHHIRFGLAASFILGLLVILLHSSPVTYWTPSGLGDSSLVSYLLGLLYSSWGCRGKYTGVVCIPSSCESRFVRTPYKWPICLGWLCMAWLMASWNYTSPSARRRQCSIKGIGYYKMLNIVPVLYTGSFYLFF